MPASAPAPAADLWPGLIAGLKGRVPMGEYTFLNNAAMVREAGGRRAYPVVESDFVKIW